MRKLKVPMDAAMPCKKGTKKHETEARSCESNKIPNIKHACVVEAHVCTRQHLESTLPKDHEDHIAEQGFNSLRHYNLWTARLTRHIFSFNDTHMRGLSRKIGAHTSHSMCHLHALMFCVWFSSTSPLSSLCCLYSLLSCCLSSCPSTSSSTMWWTNSQCTSANEDLGTLAEYDPFTVYEPNDYHISDATEPYIQESSGENGSLNDLEYDDVTIGIALSSPLFT